MRVTFTTKGSHINVISKVWAAIMGSDFTMMYNQEMRFGQDGIVPDCRFEIETENPDELRRTILEIAKVGCPHYTVM